MHEQITPEEELPTDALEVLKDGKWHPVYSRPRMSSRDDSLLIFWIGKKGQDDVFDGMTNASEAECYRLDFKRWPDSWAREGFDLACRGNAVVDGRQIPAYFLAMERGEFLILHEDRPRR